MQPAVGGQFFDWPIVVIHAASRMDDNDPCHACVTCMQLAGRWVKQPIVDVLGAPVNY